MASFPGLENLLNVCTALLGISLTGIAIFKFIEAVKYGNTAPGGTHLITPAMYLLCGTALLNFAASIDTFLETLYGTSTSVHNLPGYRASNTRLTQQGQLMLKALIACLQLYGYFTFARGWLSMRRIGSGQNGSDELFKIVIVRLFAGIGLINIVETVNVISATFGFGDIL